MKEGLVLLMGRPNVGKSTFVNNVIGQKVAITSPKPQTTRFPIQGFYQDPRGKIIFTDTPGIFDKAPDLMSKKVNESSLRELNKDTNVVLYFVDPTRRRDYEEARVLGLIRQARAPVILVFNKEDLHNDKYLAQYKFLEDEFKDVFHISAIDQTHVKPLMDRIFEILPEVSEDESKMPENLIYPLLSMDSKTFIAELIREKVFIMMGEEIPYTTTAIVDQIKERANGVLYIKARILTVHDRYKAMLIGAAGRKIKEIGSYARKEIALATDKKVFMDLTIEVDPDWQSTLYS